MHASSGGNAECLVHTAELTKAVHQRSAALPRCERGATLL
jgi:hypothetical protein